MGASTEAWEAIHKALERGAELAAENGCGDIAEDLACKMAHGVENPSAEEAALFDRLKGLAYEVDNALNNASTALWTAAENRAAA